MLSKDQNHWEEVQIKTPPVSWGAKCRIFVVARICDLGTLAFSLARLIRRRRDTGIPKKMLVVRRGGLGEALMLTPLLQGLRSHFPQACVAVLISRQAAAALDGNPCLDRIFEVPSGKREYWNLVKELRRERFDTAFILHRFFAPSLLALAAGIPRRLGFCWKGHGFALTTGVPFSSTRSQVVQIAELMKIFGAPVPEPQPRFDVDPRKTERARELLREWEYDPGRPLIGIHPGGGQTAGFLDFTRRWLPERFGELADLLAQRDQVQVLLLQGPGDEPFIAATLAAMRLPPLRVVANLDLSIFAAIVGECDLLVANDSAPMHIAAARGVPVVAIFGSTHPAYNPPGGPGHEVLWAGVPCSPCQHPDELAETIPLTGQKKFECWRGTLECMRAITAEDVYAAVKERLRAIKSLPQ